MWNLPIWYLQETTIDLFIAAFWTIRETFFKADEIEQEQTKSTGPVAIGVDGRWMLSSSDTAVATEEP